MVQKGIDCKGSDVFDKALSTFQSMRSKIAGAINLAVMDIFNGDEEKDAEINIMKGNIISITLLYFSLSLLVVTLI